MESTWELRDLPVLEAVVHYLDEHPQGVMLRCEEVAKLAGRDLAEVYRALKILEPTYVRLAPGLGSPSVRGVTDQARRVVGQWPSAELWVERLVQALREAAERESDPERQGRLRALAEGLGGFARDVAVGVLSGRITQTMGSTKRGDGLGTWGAWLTGLDWGRQLRG